MLDKSFILVMAGFGVALFVFTWPVFLVNVGAGRTVAASVNAACLVVQAAVVIVQGFWFFRKGD